MGNLPERKLVAAAKGLLGQSTPGAGGVNALKELK
jgi:hypothetical protein